MRSFVNKTAKYAKLIWSSQFYNKTHRFSDPIFECHAHLQQNFEVLQRSAAALQNLRVKLWSAAAFHWSG